MCVLSRLALSDSVRSCGAEALSLWDRMKQRDGLAAADGGELRATLEVILAAAEVKHHAIPQASLIKESPQALSATFRG